MDCTNGIFRDRGIDGSNVKKTYLKMFGVKLDIQKIKIISLIEKIPEIVIFHPIADRPPVAYIHKKFA